MALVSAILPTRGRPEWARQAVDCFCAQTYPEKELIILDDMHDRSFPDGAQSLPSGYPILYFMDESRSIPQKRNRACELARGEILWTLDSDDWSDPRRMADQVLRLEESGKSVTAYSSMFFWVEPGGPAFKYVGHSHYGVGTSLCYRKAWWTSNRFDQRQEIGEDNEAVKRAVQADQFISSDVGQLMVARAHHGNTSPKRIGGNEYRAVPVDALPKGFFA